MPRVVRLAVLVVALDLQHRLQVQLAVDVPLELDLVVDARDAELLEALDEHVDLLRRRRLVEAVVHESAQKSRQVINVLFESEEIVIEVGPSKFPINSELFQMIQNN